MIDVYVNDIKKSLENKCYFTALALTLALPDICGSIEYPDEMAISRRYISWYDKYLGSSMSQGKNVLGENNPWLSGEVLYNLRNTYLHTGSPNIVKDKVKEAANQIDWFILVLGDGTTIWDSSFAIDIGHGKIKFKGFMIDVTYLCDCICTAALDFYEKNKENFQFHFQVIPQEAFFNQTDYSSTMQETPPAQTAHTTGQEPPLNQADDAHFLESIKPLLSDLIQQNPTILSPLYTDASQTNIEKPAEKKENVTKKKQTAKKTGPVKKTTKSRREAQIRSFYGNNFKEAAYIGKKEVIIQAVLQAATRQQVNTRLMKHFSSEETGQIFKKLKPLIKDLPGT